MSNRFKLTKRQPKWRIRDGQSMSWILSAIMQKLSLLIRLTQPHHRRLNSLTLWGSYWYCPICNAAINTHLIFLSFLFKNCTKFWVLNQIMPKSCNRKYCSLLRLCGKYYNLERKKLNNKLETKCRKCSQIICKHQIKRICEKCEDVWMRTLCCKPVVQ